MFRSIAVAALAVAAVSVASANDVMLPTVDACNQGVIDLEKVASMRATEARQSLAEEGLRAAGPFLSCRSSGRPRWQLDPE